MPPTVGWDYQLGGGSTPESGVGMVVRDRTDRPEQGLFNVCYVNGFQTQPGDRDWWLTEHPDLVLTADGHPVIDPDWPDELVLDIGSEENRRSLVEVVGAWIDGCAADGFDAVEIDNLDTFSRFPDVVESDAIAYATALVDRAHRAGLAIAQKNTAQLLGRVPFDFAIVEQCAEFDECEAFVDHYGAFVFDVEYDAEAFRRACRERVVADPIRRDLGLAPPTSPDHLRETC